MLHFCFSHYDHFIGWRLENYKREEVQRNRLSSSTTTGFTSAAVAQLVVLSFTYD